jgi:hypothetical protein
MNKWFGLFAVAAALCVASGCQKKPPPVVEASGRLTLNGKPLPHATVEFIPELKDFGAEMISTAVTDEDGRFELICAYRNQPGAVVATHRVVVTDVTPAEARGMDGDSQMRAARRQASLKNRPIPDRYRNFTLTPVRVTVEKGKTTYDVELTREARK